MTEDAHARRQYGMMYKVIRKKYGEGWKLLGDDLKKSIATEHVFYLFASRDEPTNPNKMVSFQMGFFNYLGLE